MKSTIAKTERNCLVKAYLAALFIHNLPSLSWDVRLTNTVITNTTVILNSQACSLVFQNPVAFAVLDVTEQE